MTQVRTAIAELRTALEGDDVDAVKSKQEELARISQELGSALYAQNDAEANAASGAGASGASAGSSSASSSQDDDVVDAEVVDDDQPKK